jgi:hypothetical protein
MSNPEKKIGVLEGKNKTERIRQINLASYETDDGECFPAHLNTKSDYEKNSQKSH